MPELSFVIPILNEGNFLTETLASLMGQEMGDRQAEVLLVDGGSSDDSVAIAEEFAARSDGRVVFRVLHNPRRRTPAAFNIGIAAARGKIVGLGGAHTTYPPRYFLTAIELLESGIADVVGGGHNEHVASKSSALGDAMACLYVSRMGSGVAAYHRMTAPGFVDTVYGGFYLKRVFERIGVFDESLTRNQDNELNARVLAAGMRIYFHPALSSRYVLKADFRTFLLRGYRFGRFHTETWARTPHAFRFRHAAPALFVAYLLVAAVVLAVGGNKWVLLPLAVYACLLVVAGFNLSRRKPVGVAILATGLFFLYHCSYGVGTLFGAVTYPARRAS